MNIWYEKFDRFYGDSIPNNNTGSGPYSTENLRYLTSQQALADAAYFIENFQVETLPFLIRKVFEFSTKFLFLNYICVK